MKTVPEGNATGKETIVVARGEDPSMQELAAATCMMFCERITCIPQVVQETLHRATT